MLGLFLKNGGFMNEMQQVASGSVVVFLSKGDDPKKVHCTKVAFGNKAAKINTSEKNWKSAQNLKNFASAFEAFGNALLRLDSSKRAPREVRIPISRPPKQEINTHVETYVEGLRASLWDRDSNYSTLEPARSEEEAYYTTHINPPSADAYDPTRITVTSGSYQKLGENCPIALTGNQQLLEEEISKIFFTYYPPHTTVCFLLTKNNRSESSASGFANVQRNNKDIAVFCKNLIESEFDINSLREKLLKLDTVKEVDSDNEDNHDPVEEKESPPRKSS